MSIFEIKEILMKTDESYPMSVPAASEEQLTEEDLQVVYTWIDSIPLSRPKRNITRDFADGCLTAEVVKHYIPKLVELHNYS